MLTLTAGDIIHEPFPVAVFDNIMPQDKYDELLATFPTNQNLSDDRVGASRYNKFYMSDRHQKDDFHNFMSENELWKELYDEIRSDFAQMCYNALGSGGFPNPHVSYARTWSNMEFSALPADGGGLLPHPDNHKKVATAVLFMENDWKPEWGGAFEVLRRPDGAEEVDLAPWDEVETVKAVEVRPRRIVFMHRTPISYHGVRPIHAPRPRRSLTINLTARLNA
jgi:hypothetical protein